MPPSIKARVSSLTLEEWFEIYQTSVIDVRQVVDWAGNSAELNTEQIGLVGISFGGFISSIAMGLDKRIKAGVFLVSGGNSEKIARESRRRTSIRDVATETGKTEADMELASIDLQSKGQPIRFDAGTREVIYGQTLIDVAGQSAPVISW